MSKILVVDDDPHIRELIGVFLRAEGFDICEASDGVEALAKLVALKVDMVILDVMMPKMDGWDLCRELRASYDFPLLMLTAKGETSQKIKGFQLGADDYLVKPFEPLELVARVKALLKRYRIAVSQTVQIADLLMDRKTFEVAVRGESLTLPRKEFELLFKLASYPGKTLSREQLIEAVVAVQHRGARAERLRGEAAVARRVEDIDVNASAGVDEEAAEARDVTADGEHLLVRRTRIRQRRREQGGRGGEKEQEGENG